MKVKKLQFKATAAQNEVVANVDFGVVDLSYSIEHFPGTFRVSLFPEPFSTWKVGKVGYYPSLSEAKEAAQKHFEDLVNGIIKRVTEE